MKMKIYLWIQKNIKTLIDFGDDSNKGEDSNKESEEEDDKIGMLPPSSKLHKLLKTN